VVIGGKLKILCLGNADNVGIRIYLWLKESDQEVELYRLAVDEDQKRGNPYLYSPKEEVDEDPKIQLIKDSLLRILGVSIFGSKQIDYINKNFDLVLITSGYHALSLSNKIHLPKILLPIGHEIQCAGFRVLKLADILIHPRHLLRNFIYRGLAKKALFAVDRIFESTPDNISILKSLGLERKIDYVGFGEDIQKNRKLVNQEKLSQLNRETQGAKRVFLWFTRLSYFDPSLPTSPIYKGADLFFESLENFVEELKAGDLIVYMGKHGQDAQKFDRIAKKSDVYQYIRWVDHLDHPDVVTYLSIKNAVVFTQLGVSVSIPGIGRDGYSIGTPMVNCCTEEGMKAQYTLPGPRIYAKEPAEITSAMSALLNMGEEEFENIRRETALYGEKYIDKSFFLKRLYKEIENLTCNSNLTLPS
jgi:glycosyltransferase involved in cell wall biosynthesis